MSSNCPRRYELALWVGGDLAPQRVAAVEKHLTECGACQAWYRGLQLSQQALEEARQFPFDMAETEASLWPAISARLQADSVAQPMTKRPSMWGRVAQKWSWSVVAAAALLVFVVAEPFWSGHRWGNDTSVSSRSASERVVSDRTAIPTIPIPVAAPFSDDRAAIFPLPFAGPSTDEHQAWRDYLRSTMPMRRDQAVEVSDPLNF